MNETELFIKVWSKHHFEKPRYFKPRNARSACMLLINKGSYVWEITIAVLILSLTSYYERKRITALSETICSKSRANNSFLKHPIGSANVQTMQK